MTAKIWGEEKNALLIAGKALVKKWCRINGVSPPDIHAYPRTSPFSQCAYYRHGAIRIWPIACAKRGHAGRQYSWPGYSVDRTPYGVLAHELGHHVEGAHDSRGGIRADPWRKASCEAPLTGYCPNDNEWFAEMFRLFLTNPHLLKELRPMTWALMMNTWPERVEVRRWGDVLEGADRQISAAKNKIAKVQRSQGQRSLC